MKPYDIQGKLNKQVNHIYLHSNGSNATVLVA